MAIPTRHRTFLNENPKKKPPIRSSPLNCVDIITIILYTVNKGGGYWPLVNSNM